MCARLRSRGAGESPGLAPGWFRSAKKTGVRLRCLARNEAFRASGMRGDGMGFVSGVAWVVILFQETRELVPIEPPPAFPQAGETFEFAACRNRHENASLDWS